MKKPVILAAAVSTLLFAPHVFAVMYYLDTNGPVTFNSASSWSPDSTSGTTGGNIPGAADIATITQSSLSATAATVTLDAPQSVLGLVFNTTQQTSTTVGGVTTITPIPSTLTAGAGGAANVLTIGTSGITLATGTTSATVGSQTAASNMPIVLGASQSWLSNTTSTVSTGALIVYSPISAGTTGATLLTLGGASSTTPLNTIAGAISDGVAGAVLSITMNPGNTGNRWTLSGNNSYTGATTVSSGALTIGSVNALGSTAAGTSVASGAGLFFRGTVGTVAEPLTIAGTGPTAGAGALRNVAGTNTVSGPITANTTSSVGVAFGADAGQLTISSNITANGTGTVSFSGASSASTGVVIVQGDLSGSVNVSKVTTAGAVSFDTVAKTYSGTTTLNAGSLVDNVALSTSGVTVAATTAGTSAFLRGNGGIMTAAVTLSGTAATALGTLAPGAIPTDLTSVGTIGTLTTGALTMGSFARFGLDINSSVATPTSDVVQVNGNLSLNAANDVILLLKDDATTSVTLAMGTVIPFIKYTGTWNNGLFAVGGTAITDNGNTFNLGANSFQLDYNYVNAGVTSVALIAVPEPGILPSLIGGLGLLIGFARRRRS